MNYGQGIPHLPLYSPEPEPQAFVYQPEHREDYRPHYRSNTAPEYPTYLPRVESYPKIESSPKSPPIESHPGNLDRPSYNSFRSTEPPAPQAPQKSCGTHSVKSGENMFRIAKKLGVSLDALKAANPNVNPETMSTSTILNIPCVIDVDSSPKAKRFRPSPVEPVEPVKPKEPSKPSEALELPKLMGRRR